MKQSAIAIAVLATLASVVFEARAATFSAWKITNVPWGDTLNVRKYPANHSQKQAAYPNGTVLQMTGKCTNGVDLFEISGKSNWAQRQAVRFSWCQVWHEPKQNGDFVTGWVYGKYIRPQ